MKRLVILMALVTFLAAACGTPEPVATAPTIALTTASLPALPTGTPTLSPAPLQPTATATPIFIEGTLTIKVNVRSGPGTGYSSLGQMEAGGKVQITARDSQGTWFLILFPAASQGNGWVAAQYVTVAPGSQIPLDATPTPSGPTGRLLQRLNVRGGPGTTFDSLGMLEPGVVVSLTGKNTTASWFQVDYPAGPGGRGWVTSQYIQTDATADLPVLDDYGNLVTPVAGGTPSGPFVSPTPTVGPAYPDGDSSASPAIRITFSSTGTHQFIYSSQVSAPEGDVEDWVEFTPYATTGTIARLNFSLACAGNGTLAVELWQAGARLSGWGALACGDAEKPILLSAGEAYEVRLSPAPGDDLRLVAYTLTVQDNP
jgi:uncharacterized protein YraI